MATNIPFNDAYFRTTHNSYEGGNERRSIVEQLTHGVRCLEFDIHDNGYTDWSDYRLGHDEPGHAHASVPALRSACMSSFESTADETNPMPPPACN